ncbi:PAAR domain-containing protein [uncultured Pseudomonas sp.]|uniref:PAAR domain-containing protein n=1 Tax=uncultured Pseudomonas sp. TaxID=114707 RepID=UPI0025CE8430|nr:PAAR domain-containing protein [uncultured Pseudomonas sp.]
MKRYHITVGAKTTADGTVRTGNARCSIDGMAQSVEGDEIDCPACESTGVIVCDGPRRVDRIDGRNAALNDDLCHCKCDPPPRLIANQRRSSQTIEVNASSYAKAETLTATVPKGTEVRSTQSHPRQFFTPQPVPTCENTWRRYQDQAEAIVAPGGTLIADPKARNRAINAAYAQLWRLDNRFQWAGLAAFASKQVGCGLLHASESMEKIQAEHEAAQALRKGARDGFWSLFNPLETQRQAKLLEYEQRQLEYERAIRNNPLPGIDWRRDGEPFSAVQQLYQHVYEMMAMGNTTLFLDVYPLHVFYMERGLRLLESCLPSRKNIYENVQQTVLWPVGNEKLVFGRNHREILQAFEAINAGNIEKSVVHLAWHEQRNILQPTMYTDQKLVALLRSNHLSYVTGIPSGAAQAIELTLASQCSPVKDGRTIGFSNNPIANLADIDQRMAFVLKAARQFGELLHSSERIQIEQAIEDIAEGRGIQ